MARLDFRGIVSVAVIVATLAGCSSRDDLTRTEQRRLEVGPEVERFLAEAQRAYQNGRFLTALSMADSAERRAPDLADIHFLRGSVYTALNQYEMAEAAYEAALAADPEYPGAHMNLGINLVRNGALRAGLEEFEQEEAINPNSALYLEVGRTYAKLGAADSAEMAYEKSIELDSTNTTALMWVGQLYEETGDFEKALEYSRRGLALRPDDMDYQYIVGSQLFRTGQVEEAATYLRPVADERPWHHGAQYNMGQALIHMGEEEAAQEYLAQADSAQQLQQAINDAKDAINRNPDDIQNWIQLGEAHRNAHMYDRAIDAFKAAVSFDPKNLGLQMNLATVYLESGDAAEAVKRYRGIIEIDSTITDAWLNLGAAYGNAGEYDEARNAWDRVLEMDPGNRRARAYLAQLRQIAEAE